AVAAVRRCLSDSHLALERNRLLPGAVEVLIAGGESDEADVLVQEVSDIADAFGCISLRAASRYAVAQVALARGLPEEALAALRLALADWASLDCAYEMARCRVLLGGALRLLGDEDSAVAELGSARTEFASLGARPAEQAVSDLLGPRDAPAGLSAREVEVLSLVAG